MARANKVIERLHVHDATYVTSDPALPGTQVYANVRMHQSFPRPVVQSGLKNENFREEIAKKVDATRDYFSTWGHWYPARYRAECIRTSISISNPSWRASGGGFVTSVRDPDLLVEDFPDNDLRDVALTRFKRKLAAESGFFNAAVPIGELRELRKTIRGTLPAINALVRDSWKLVKSARRLKSEGDVRFAKRLETVKKDLSQVWLTFNFGIRPTLSDMEKILASIRKFLEAPPNARIRGSSKKEWHTGKHYPITSFLYGANIASQWNLHHVLRYSYIGGVSFKMTYDSDYQLDDQLGLGLSGLPSVGWELFPFSWVLDYYANVGQWLDDEFVVPPGALLYLVETRKYHVSGVEHGHPFPVLRTDAVLPGSFKAGSFAYGSFKRTKLTKLPHIGFRLRSFDEVGKNALQKLANLTSLAKLDATKLTEERVENQRRLKQSQRAVRRGVRGALLGVKTKTKK